MAPNSRPPLTTRIRNSFEGKRSKSEVTSPVHNGFVTQDPNAFRHVIDEAINSESFQNAIAANIARILKPSIKDALDTLQPIVEAVYSHEVLLRKTNRSVEDLLTRIDTGGQTQHTIPPSPRGSDSPGTPTTPRQRKLSEASNIQDIDQFRSSLEKNNKRTVATLAELSSAVEGNNKKIAQVVDGFGDIQATLVPTKEGFDSLRSFSDTSNTNTAVMQAQLDQLKADIGLIIDAVGSDLGHNVKGISEQVGEHPALLASHSTKLDAISTDIVALKGQADVVEKIQSMSADLDALKSFMEGNIPKQDQQLSNLGSQVGSVLTAVEGHTGTLAEIKDANSSTAILEAVQKSNDSHGSHAAVLGEIKERSLAPASVSEPAHVAPGDDSGSTAVLEALKADLAALKENIETGLSSNNENITGLGSKVDNVLTAVEEHKAADQSTDILAAVQKSNDSHASHAEALEGVKSLGGEAPAAPVYDTNFAALEAQIVALQTTLHSHTGALDELKTSNPTTSTELVPTAEAGSSGDISAIITTLEAQSSLLNEIKDDVAAEILTALHDIGQSQASHSTILAEIRESDVSDEILTALHASNDSHASHTATLGELHSAVRASNDSHSAHTASLDELKTARAIEPSAPAEAGNLGALEAQIGTLVSTLEEHKATLAEIKDAATASNESHNSHAISLDEIKSRSVEPAPSSGVNLEALESQITALSTSLEEHKATLAEIKDATLASNESHVSHAASLDEIKSRAVEPVPSSGGNIEALESQIGAITTSLEEHKASLAAIHEATNVSNASHAAHAASLEELKSRSVEPVANPETGDAGPQIDSIIATLEEQNATLAAIKDTAIATHALQGSHTTALGEIIDSTTAASDFHASHAATLAEFKDTTAGLRDFHNAHAVALGEIKDGHASHAATLSDIRDATAASNESHAAHTASLAELKSIQPSETSRSAPDDLPALEEHFTNIVSTLEAQNNALAEIKEATTNPNVLSAVKQSHELLSSHTPLLESIKEGTSHEDILSHISELKSSIEESKAGVDAHGALVKDLHAETKGSHSELTQAIGALALGGAAGAGTGALASHSDDNNSAEILEEVKAVRAIVEKSSTTIDDTEEKVTSIVSQIDINHTTITTSITTLSDELKAEIDATGTQLADSVNILSGDVRSIDISSLGGAIEGCNLGFRNVAASIEALEGHVKETGSHVSILSEGVHLNEKGLEQLKEHTASTSAAVSERGDAMPEGSWFKKSGSGIPVLSRQIIHSPEPEPAEKEYNYLSPVAEEQTPTQEEMPVLDTPKEEEAVEEQVPADVEEDSVPTPVADIEPEPAPIEESVPAPNAEPEPAAIEEDDDPALVADAESEPAPYPAEHEPIAEAPEPELEAVQEQEQKFAAPEPEVEAIPEVEPVVEAAHSEIDETPEPVVEEPGLKEEATAAPEHKDIGVEEEALIPEAQEVEPVHATKEIEPEEAEAVPIEEAAPLETDLPIQDAAPIEDGISIEEAAPIEEANDPQPEDEPTHILVEKELESVENHPQAPEIEEHKPIHEEQEAVPIANAEGTQLEEDSTPTHIPEDKEVEPMDNPAPAPEILEHEPVHQEKEAMPDEEPAISEAEAADPEPILEKVIEPEALEVDPEPIQEKEIEPVAQEADPEPIREKEIEHEAPAPESEAHIEPEQVQQIDEDIEPPMPIQEPSEHMEIGAEAPTPEEPSTPLESASTSAFASPTSPSFPASGGGKKGKKGKKEKKEKKGKGKKEKVPFSMDGEEPEED
ncbi:hypothetical protein LSUE1_G005009 [Lachnellula suecica]|uniref:Uncharacterized protein n=1 Tax=Lachnellula suecica TaxID=602035 RepID=A0A8T9CBR5_9HELO|nr:hypothetical protein LSUE1_G005009 [Lachnellula suecica]